MTPSYMADTEEPKINTEDWDGVLVGSEEQELGS